ncbi:MAG: hypothetical protein QE271_10045 [Bacteriovoracaceae bacterium]|nr:hypothetical protein [Bacteriovoracaceae bacterium]
MKHFLVAILLFVVLKLMGEDSSTSKMENKSLVSTNAVLATTDAALDAKSVNVQESPKK